MKVEIRKIRKNELHLIRDFPPPDWNLDLENEYYKHFGKNYFYPVVATVKSTIVGTGIAVINDNVSWLGTIIVREDYRNNGIGKLITSHLINYSKSKGMKTILLFATELGLPLYQKLGFQHDLNYLSFKSNTIYKFCSEFKSITRITNKDYQHILELDYAITGEKRKELLTSTLNTGFKYKDSLIKGFYLPDFGRGLIIASSENAGLELLKFRLILNPSTICVPETNKRAIEFLTSIGFYQYSKIPRMYLDKNIIWNSKNVYSRGCGHLG
jgi:ribosomal protein S18 acetylase RimI-like enzyme